jgi:hypothetical protein
MLMARQLGLFIRDALIGLGIYFVVWTLVSPQRTTEMHAAMLAYLIVLGLSRVLRPVAQPATLIQSETGFPVAGAPLGAAACRCRGSE